MDDTPHGDGPTKGAFGEAGLPVSATYIYPSGRNRIWWFGLGLAGVVGLILAVNLNLQSGALVSSGALSSSHAVIGGDCVACHSPFGEVSSEKCALCHEDGTAAVGAFSLDAHYVYVSGDHTRAFRRDGEMTCAGCHTEHRGRTASVTTVSTTGCVACHGIERLADHPEFSAIADGTPDDAGLAFTHIRHVDRVMEDRGTGDLEAACLACHLPTADARGFEPMAFATQCANCHLGAEVEGAELPIQLTDQLLVDEANGVVSLALGVETLETIRVRQGPGERWALDMSVAQFDADDGYVVKRATAHEDPWVTHNLQRLRRAVYPMGGLSDLLLMSADVRPEDEEVLYQEALSTLREYADGLRGRSEAWVQAELLELDRLAADLQARLADDTTTLNDARFRLNRPDPRLEQSHLDEIDAFANEVAAPCLTCHTVRHGTIDRVRPAQGVLRRATFDHGAHVLQRGCLDCHTAIPFEAHLGGDGPVDAALDNAAIQNLPAVGECRQCHTPDLASDGCLTCHDFHPRSDVRSRLLR
jgi:hypothetical protein